jgi:uncharacterized phage protein (TIGR01671 family)
MSREILFRGKTDNKWVYGVPIYLRKEAYIVRDFCLGGSYTDDWVEAETVGQFTGLTDKNGKKIFEGDIVKGLFLHGSAILGIVAFQDGAFGLAWKRGKIDEFSPFPCMCNVDYEIVGNIHDNPELLGE